MVGVGTPTWAETAYPCAPIDDSHAALTIVLRAHIQGGLVDYSGLKGAGQQKLTAYLKSLANECPKHYAESSREAKLSYWLNYYNAATLQLILQNHPVPSIMAIGPKKGAAFDIPLVEARVLGNGKVSLNHLENDIIRPLFKEPRIHVALVCAAISCPSLQAEAFRGDFLETQLASLTKRFLSDPAKNQLNTAGNQVLLSKIFEWYLQDFGGSHAGLLSWIDSQLPAAKVAGKKVAFSDYDWALNDQPKGPRSRRPVPRD